MKRLSGQTWNTAVGYLAAVVLAGVTGFALGAAFSTGCRLDPQNAPFGCAEFLLSRYQTMIAAVIAVIAVFPVWRQVRLQGMQTDILKSEALRQRVSTLSKMKEDFANDTSLVRERIQWYPENVGDFHHWAHEAEAQVDACLRFLSSQKELRLDAERVAATRADLIEKLTVLSRELWVVNWDVHLNGEEAPDDEQEKELRAEATAAIANLETSIGATLRSLSVLASAIHDDISLARSKLHALSESLVAHGD